ncbi:hypothetical protein Sme01_15940 [Sphaerisporangium melleum]|uniref:Uncharacterized protein n=1 Tax=Sphaerisporangium melleum TaxID=321316 RepID=A0A917RJ61_9ACTN|nr:hypothetical protein [Sphaerisporangium melleum]GGL10695.1 hypothetical protein GCM10007964_61100 [Sphaerisporangium melleum]GII69118.1 hypothetical protein Sme01_15940 [Sphaerisporangium melleum]
MGEEIGEFATATTQGKPLSSAHLRGTTTVGFFTPGCEPCEEELFADHLRAGRPEPGGIILAMAIGLVTGLLVVMMDDLLELLRPVDPNRL